MDKVRQSHEWQLMSAKYMGVGNADSGREALVSQRQDTLALLAHHHLVLAYTLAAQNKHPAVMRQDLQRKI